jgi:DNA-binding response OmpR family regulator
MNSPKKLLIIDDDTALCHFLRLIFERLEFEVYTGSDGKEGLLLARQHRPELILLDIKMPKMDGIEFLKQFRAEAAGKPFRILVLSAKDQLYQIREALNAGADDYLCKPALREDIVRKVLSLATATPSK